MASIILLPREQLATSKLGFSILLSSNRSSSVLRSRTSVATCMGGQTQLNKSYLRGHILNPAVTKFEVKKIESKKKNNTTTGKYCSVAFI